MSTIPFPLSALEKQARNHAVLCTIGYLILLPLGALIARYLRTWTNRWWFAHATVQLLISGPVIFVGWSMGYKTSDQLGLGHFIDPHQKMGLALLILYVTQLVLGAFIHFVKMKAIFRGRRPPQNYLHVFLGLVILVVAASQVHYGLYTEWPIATGGLHQVPESAKHAWLAFIVIFWVLYFVGMGFLPRQFKQERNSKPGRNEDHIPLHDGQDGARGAIQT